MKVPKTVSDYCKKCNKHTDHKLKQFKSGKARSLAEGQRKNIRLLASPSTCFQFKPNSDQFGFDEKDPGLRWIHLKKDGSFETGVQRAKGFKSTVDMDATGY